MKYYKTISEINRFVFTFFLIVILMEITAVYGQKKLPGPVADLYSSTKDMSVSDDFNSIDWGNKWTWRAGMGDSSEQFWIFSNKYHYLQGESPDSYLHLDYFYYYPFISAPGDKQFKPKFEGFLRQEQFEGNKTLRTSGDIEVKIAETEMGIIAFANDEVKVKTRLHAKMPGSKFKGVQIGAITYSWRSMPSSAEDILKYCLDCGISSIELMGNVVETYAGIPASVPRIPRGTELSDKEKEARKEAIKEATEAQRQWRLSVSMDKFKELRKLFKKAGVSIHIVRLPAAGWTDEEVDYAFKVAKVLGAKGISTEIGHQACKRLGEFAEKHDMYAIFHNHGQPGEPGFSFDEFLDYSPNVMLNFDVGHYFGATGKHPNEIIEKLHDRIVSIHLKDKTGKDANPANTNKPWGQGETPLEDILKLIEKNNWDIICDIELEYRIPDGSDAVKEVCKCVEYCRNILL